VIDLQQLGFKREEGRYVVLSRANGTSMYVARDLAYTIFKSEISAMRTCRCLARIIGSIRNSSI
jgi:arginyl-tRNA synthetase